MVSVEQKQSECLILTQEGEELAENGSYEANLYDLVPDDGLLQAKLKVRNRNLLI